MKRIILVFIAVMMLFGCARRFPERPSWIEGDFECELSYELSGVRVRGVLRSEIGESERRACFSFIEPEALSGVSVTRENGKLAAELDGMEIEGEEFLCWLEVERLFACEGELVESDKTELGGKRVEKLVFLSHGGEREDIYISIDTGEPQRLCGKICGEDTVCEVIWFERK